MKDSTEQGPIHGPRLDGFAFVGAVAVNALLADVNLPAAEIGGRWFHGLGVGDLSYFFNCEFGCLAYGISALIAM